MIVYQQDLAAGPDVTDTDTILARQIATGDTGAWDSFFDRYSAWTYRFAYNHLNRNHADAEDLCSDILLTAAKSIGKYDPRRGGLDSWLRGLANHRLSRFCRSRRIEHPLNADQSSDLEPTSAGFANEAEARYVVNLALASLPERQATALVAKYVEGCTTDELAQRIDSSPKAVESLLVRARAAFRSVFSSLMEDTQGGGNRGQR